MGKGVSDKQNLSPDARDWLDNRMVRVERRIIATATLLAAKSNDDMVLPSHIETAWEKADWDDIIGKSTSKKRLGLLITASALMGGIVQSLFGGIGRSVGEHIFHLFGR
jgi:hypothetical protein